MAGAPRPSPWTPRLSPGDSLPCPRLCPGAGLRLPGSPVALLYEVKCLFNKSETLPLAWLLSPPSRCAEARMALVPTSRFVPRMVGAHPGTPPGLRRTLLRQHPPPSSGDASSPAAGGERSWGREGTPRMAALPGDTALTSPHPPRAATRGHQSQRGNKKSVLQLRYGVCYRSRHRQTYNRLKPSLNPRRLSARANQAAIGIDPNSINKLTMIQNEAIRRAHPEGQERVWVPKLHKRCETLMKCAFPPAPLGQETPQPPPMVRSPIPAAPPARARPPSRMTQAGLRKR